MLTSSSHRGMTMTHNRRLLLLAAFVSALGVATLTQAVQTEPRARGAQSKDDGAKSEKEAEEMISAVVRVKMKATAGARSNSNLGSTREGTGVVIDDKGHIFTIR